MRKILHTWLAAALAFVVVVQAEDLGATGAGDSVDARCGSYGLELACPAGCFSSFIIQHYDGTPGKVNCQVVTKLGYYSTENSTLLRPCEPGFFSNETRASACQPCPAGSFSRERGSAECTRCPSGYYQDETGQPECKKCSSYYYAGEGAKAVAVDTFGDQFCQLDEHSTAPSVSPSAAPSPRLGAPKTREPSMDLDWPPKTAFPSWARSERVRSFSSPTGPSSAESPPSNAPSISPKQSSAAVVTLVSPAEEPWKAPFVIAAVSLGSVFVISLFSLLGQKRPSKDATAAVGGSPPGWTDGRVLVDQDHRHNLGIVPMQLLPETRRRRGDDIEQPSVPPRFTPLAPRNIDNGVPELYRRPALVTPYYHPEEETKIPDASFESFGYCYEDPEIAAGFPDHNDSTMAVVSGVNLNDDDAPAPMWEGPFEMASDMSGVSHYAIEHEVFPEHMYDMSPMSGSFDL